MRKNKQAGKLKYVLGIHRHESQRQTRTVRYICHLQLRRGDQGSETSKGKASNSQEYETIAFGTQVFGGSHRNNGTHREILRLSHVSLPVYHTSSHYSVLIVIVLQAEAGGPNPWVFTAVHGSWLFTRQKQNTSQDTIGQIDGEAEGME